MRDETCRQFDALIARAGQLSSAEATMLEAHLAACVSCRELARLLQPASSIAFAETNASVGSTPAPATAARQDHDLPAVPTDRYRIHDEVGRGGIGRVMRALDRVLDRPVALKELFAANDGTRRRFMREALITARLQHPSIVPIYDAGYHADRSPYYAMKLVAGRPLDESIAEASTLAQRLAVLPTVLAVADAMAYAHNERIIHRDLKPTNVLVGRYGETVVIDWGLAKDLAVDDRDALDAGPYRSVSLDHTVAGVVMGTPAYMAPEQAAGEPVDERADVYALGAILYHVVSGAIPHEGTTLEEMVNRVVSGAVRPLTEREPDVPRDLAAIVNKAMALEPSGRYATAQGLADDLRRYLTGQLVASHTYGTGELLRRWIKRHRGAVTVALAAVVVLSVVGVMSVTKIVRAREQADDAAAVATHTLADMLAEQGRQELLAGRPSRAAVYLSEAQTQGHESDVAFRALFADAMRSLDAQRMSLEGQVRELTSAKFSPDGTRIVTVSRDDSARLWDAATGTVVATMVAPKRSDGFTSVSFSPDSSRMVTVGGSDGVGLWDARTGRQLARFDHDHETMAAAFSPDGTRVVTAERGGIVTLWDANNPHFVAYLLGHRDNVDSVAFSVDGTRVITAGMDGVKIWDVRSGKVLRSVDGFRAAVSPDGSRIVSIGANTTKVWLWTQLGDPVAPLDGHAAPVYTAAFSPDGSLIVTASIDRSAKLWDARTGKLLASLDGHGGQVKSAAFSPDGARVVTAGDDHTAKLWDVKTGKLLASFDGHRAAVETAVFSPDGARVLTASADGTAKVWDATPSKHLVSLEASDALINGTLSPDATRLVTCEDGPTPRLWDARSGKLVGSLDGHRGKVLDCVFDAAGTRIVTASADRTVKIWDASTQKLIVSVDDNAHAVTFSPDGARMVTAGVDEGAQIWNANSGQLIARLDGTDLPHYLIHADQVNSAVFSDDSTRVVTASKDGTARVWSADNGKLVAQLDGHLEEVETAVFSKDGERVVTGSTDNSAKVWDARTGNLIASLDGHTDRIYKATFSADGARVLTASGDNTAKLWDALTGKLLASFDGHTGAVLWASFSPDDNGARVMTLSRDNTVKLWDAQTGRLLTSLDGHASYLFELAFHGTRVWTVSNDKTIAVWDVHLETRTLPETQSIISARDPWTFSNGRLVPLPPAISSAIAPRQQAAPPGADSVPGAVTSNEDYINRLVSLTRKRYELYTHDDCDKLAASIREFPAANRSETDALHAWKVTHAIDKAAAVKALAPAARDITKNKTARAIIQKCEHTKAFAAALEDD
jgi:WD40 repeat protein